MIEHRKNRILAKEKGSEDPKGLTRVPTLLLRGTSGQMSWQSKMWHA